MKGETSNTPNSALSPLSSRINLIFVSLFTAFLVLISFFPDSHLVQWVKMKTTPDTSMVLGFVPLNIWFIIALFIGIYIPLLLLIIYKFRKWIRKLLLPYLIVFIIQIVTELILTKILFPGFALITGIIYTAYRIWQLQTAISIHNQSVMQESVMQEERAYSFLQNFLTLAAGFWMLNLVFLLSVIFV